MITKPKPVKERDDLDLLELVCQLHSRSLAYPSKDMHDAYVEARQEMEARIKAKNNFVLAPVIQRSEQLICPHCDSDNIVYYGLSKECVCNDCGEEGQINCV